MATEYCAWPDGCSGFFTYADQAERLTKVGRLNWRRYPDAPANMGSDRYLCERHGQAREEEIWRETGSKEGRPKRL